MRGKYNIHITLHFLHFYLTMSTCVMYQHNYKCIVVTVSSLHDVPHIIYFVVV